jgi:hypothetical protein
MDRFGGPFKLPLLEWGILGGYMTIPDDASRFEIGYGIACYRLRTHMTRRTWFFFASVQLLGCIAYLGYMRFFYERFQEALAPSLLGFTYRWSLFPGNVVGGLLLSTFQIHSAAAWRIGYLPVVVFLNAGFWLLCIFAFGAVREHLLGFKSHRFSIALLVTTLVFIAVNIVDNHLHRAMCADCFSPHGVPFNLYHEGGEGGGEAIMWGGLAADTLIVAAAATLIGGVWERFSGRQI